MFQEAALKAGNLAFNKGGKIMHSRIFQVSMEPILKTYYINESNYYDHWFTREIADYISDSTNRAEDIDWLASYGKGIVVSADEDGEFLIVTDREKYFKNAFEDFKEAIDEIKNCTITEFSKGLHNMWKITSAYEDKYGFYVDADGELITLDRFVRTCALNAKYYIGATVDYHC